MPNEEGMERARSTSKETLEKHGGNKRARAKAHSQILEHNRGVFARNRVRKEERAKAAAKAASGKKGGLRKKSA